MGLKALWGQTFVSLFGGAHRWFMRIHLMLFWISTCCDNRWKCKSNISIDVKSPPAACLCKKRHSSSSRMTLLWGLNSLKRLLLELSGNDNYWNLMVSRHCWKLLSFVGKRSKETISCWQHKCLHDPPHVHEESGLWDSGLKTLFFFF